MADDKTFTKADIDAAVAAAVTKVQASLDALEAKNEELIGEVRTAKQKARAASEIKPEDLTAAEERADRAETGLKEAQKLAKDAVTAKEKAEGALKEEAGFTQKLVAENGLRELLLKGGVTDPDFLELAVGKHLPNIKVVSEGDTRKAMYGDKPLDAFVAELLASDAGKKIVSAPNNHGGDAGGGSRTKADAKTITRAAFNALDQTAQGEAGQLMAKGELRVVDVAA